MCSILIRDYKRIGKPPTLNELLDWRNRIDFLRNQNVYPKKWFDIETKAVDYLLKKYYT